jgi:serine/threonine protein kinase
MARQIVWSLLSAVRYLHSRGVVHRDLKPENILCLDENDDTSVMISDFGLSKFASPAELMKIACGTLCYVAPEVLKLTGYSFSVDIWSIGVITFLLLRGRLPFDGKTKDEIIDRTLTAPVDFSHAAWQSVSAEARDLIFRLLHKDPNQRMTCEQARAHAWFEPIRSRRAGQQGHGAVTSTGVSRSQSALSSPIRTSASAAMSPSVTVRPSAASGFVSPLSAAAAAASAALAGSLPPLHLGTTTSAEHAQHGATSPKPPRPPAVTITAPPASAGANAAASASGSNSAGISAAASAAPLSGPVSPDDDIEAPGVSARAFSAQLASASAAAAIAGTHATGAALGAGAAASVDSGLPLNEARQSILETASRSTLMKP